MVGWNVAATQLVADRVHPKISDPVFYLCNSIFTVNENEMNMLKECLFECMMFPLCLVDNYIRA